MKKKNDRTLTSTLCHFAVYLLIIILIFFAVFPLLWMIATSIKPQTEVMQSPPQIFTSNPTISNYVRVITESGIPIAFLNSLVVSVATTALVLVFGILAGYGFSRFNFPGANVLSVVLLFGQMMPAIVLITPIYKIFSQTGLIDTRHGLMIAYMALTLPMSVIMLRNYITGIPKEMDEAAQIDGCSRIGALVRIIMPMAGPGMFAVGVFTFLQAWEEFLYAMNLTNSEAIRTLPVSINSFRGEFLIDWGGLMSAAVVVSLPILLIFLLCNKYFVKGFSEGAVKG